MADAKVARIHHQQPVAHFPLCAKLVFRCWNRANLFLITPDVDARDARWGHAFVQHTLIHAATEHHNAIGAAEAESIELFEETSDE